MACIGYGALLGPRAGPTMVAITVLLAFGTLARLPHRAPWAQVGFVTAVVWPG